MRRENKVGINRRQITTNVGPCSSLEQEIQIDVMLSRQFHEKEQAKFRQKINPLIKRKSAECFIQQASINIRTRCMNR